MKINWNYIKITGLTMALVGLYSFSEHRNNGKKVDHMDIEFVGDQNLYITHEAVNKLLIQNYGPLTNMPKEKLVLNNMEKVLEANEMIKDAQVYLTVDGKLTSKIVQRKPIGRVEGIAKFYVDDEGKRMPFSKNHSARVPIITGNTTEKGLKDVYTLLQHVNGDSFLKKNIIGIHIGDDGKYHLKLRMENFVVNLGSMDRLGHKFNNFRAFYNKAAKDGTLDRYGIVSLEFNKQVVCTKI